MSSNDEIPADRAGLEQDIERTRAELAETVEALAHKADVKARASDKAHELGAAANAKAHDLGDELRSSPRGQLGVIGVGVAFLAVLVLLIRRRRQD